MEQCCPECSSDRLVETNDGTVCSVCALVIDPMVMVTGPSWHLTSEVFEERERDLVIKKGEATNKVVKSLKRAATVDKMLQRQDNLLRGLAMLASALDMGESTLQSASDMWRRALDKCGAMRASYVTRAAIAAGSLYYAGLLHNSFRDHRMIHAKQALLVQSGATFTLQHMTLQLQRMASCMEELRHVKPVQPVQFIPGYVSSLIGHVKDVRRSVADAEKLCLAFKDRGVAGHTPGALAAAAVFLTITPDLTKDVEKEVKVVICRSAGIACGTLDKVCKKAKRLKCVTT